MGFTIEGSHALVTGASSGIGAAIAEGLAARGATVALCARREDRLADVLARCRVHTPESRLWVVDLADLDATTRLAHEVDDAVGGVDLLVNNAGIPKRRMVEALTDAEVESLMRINYLSPVRLTMALLPGMRARGRGAIVNLGSVAARLSPPGEAAYSATKAALTAFAEGLAVELWDSPVSVHVLHPAIIDTELFTLPDNDESYADDIEALPTSAVVDAVVEQLAAGTFEAYVPDWFADVAAGKAGNVQGFLAGAAEYLAAKRPPS